MMELNVAERKTTIKMIRPLGKGNLTMLDLGTEKAFANPSKSGETVYV